MAELYVNSIATLTPAGDLVVTLGDLADNGPRWDQLLSILPLIGHIPIDALVLKMGNREVRIPKALAKQFQKLKESARKTILKAAAAARSDKEAADIIRREVVAVLGDGQIHHPISKTVHDALQTHPNLKGKYKLRDESMEALAKNRAAHDGYETSHRDLDKEVRDWLDRNQHADQAKFEKWLTDRYAKPDLKERFPDGFSVERE